MSRIVSFVSACALLCATAASQTRIRYNNPSLKVDLGVGLWAWPMPMDWDGDGDFDLVVSCPDVPFNGVYVFENPGGPSTKFPVFKPPRRVGNAIRNAQVSYVNGKPRVLGPAREWTNFLGKTFAESKTIFPRANIHPNKVRANQWRYVDFENDGDLDLIVGVGDWTAYGWDNAFDKTGKWTRGPLRGFVYLIENKGTTAKPKYAKPRKLQAKNKPIEVFGMPSPNMADFDNDGDLDLLCGEFLDGFTWFRNIGTRDQPRFAAGVKLQSGGKPLAMDLQMITPTAIDWDRDGDVDLIVGDEDGRVALVENTGKLAGGIPQFLPPRYFKQQAHDVKFGALVTPVSVDWDGDGDEDLICGNTAGYIGFFENLDGKNPPRWAAVKLLKANGKTIRIQAGPNGSIQGPAEAKWGYTTLSVADWDHDGRKDIIVNSIWGKVLWYRNLGGTPARLAAAAPITVAWKNKPPQPKWNWWSPKGNELATQWRTTPVVIDWDRDGKNDLVMLDHEGYLAWFPRRKRAGQLELLPGRRVFFDEKGKPLRLNARDAGKSGRRKLCFADWDGDGKLDLLINSRNITWLRNISTEKSRWVFQSKGDVSKKRLAGHTTSPTTVNWHVGNPRDLLIGAEDGYLYLLRNPGK